MGRIFTNINYFLTLNNHFIFRSSIFFFQNIFRLTTSYKQLFFSLLNLSNSFTKLFSTGQLLAKVLKKFKFFKKSIFNINPVVLNLRYTYVDFFRKVYIMECLNYSKKQYLFFKKFFHAVKASVRFLLFKKTWQYTTKPVKRIKRRVVKMLKNL